MEKSIRKFSLILLITIATLTMLPARGFDHGRPSAPRGEWFSLGVGLGSDAVAFPLDGDSSPDVFQNLLLDFEFAIFPQMAATNVYLRLSIGTIQQYDLFSRPLMGPTLDSLMMLRFQTASGFAIAFGGGVHFPGFDNGTSRQLQLALEPSFALNTDPLGSSLSMGAFRISAPLAVRYDSQLNSWYMCLSLRATLYLV